MAEKRAKDQRFKSAAVYVLIQLAPPLFWQALLAYPQLSPLLAPVALHPCAKISPAAQRRPAILALASAAAWHVGRDERPNAPIVAASREQSNEHCSFLALLIPLLSRQGQLVVLLHCSEHTVDPELCFRDRHLVSSLHWAAARPLWVHQPSVRCLRRAQIERGRLRAAPSGSHTPLERGAQGRGPTWT